MTNKPNESIERLRDQIENSETISDRDRQNLIAFSDEMRLLDSTYSDQRHEKLLRHATILAGQSQRIPQEELPDKELSVVLDSKKESEAFVRWVNRRYDSVETKKDYRVTLRVFAKRVTEGESIPPSAEWIETGYPKNYDPTPNPADMLDWKDDVLPMIEASRNPRDAALAAVAWDSGLRPFELVDLTVGCVADHDYGMKVTVRGEGDQGKTGGRSVTIIPSVPYLQRWLSDHPDSQNMDAPLWSKLNEPEEGTYHNLLGQIQDMAERAGVDKPVNFRNFRKSCASYLANQGMNQPRLENRMGWSRGSKKAARYIKVFNKELDKEFARIHGMDVEEDEEDDEIGLVSCPRCGKETPEAESACLFCAQALDPEATYELEEREQAVRKAILAHGDDNADLLKDVQRFHTLLKEFGTDYDELEDVLEIAENLGAAD